MGGKLRVWIGREACWRGPQTVGKTGELALTSNGRGNVSYDEEDREDQRVVRRGKLQIGLHSSDFGILSISTIPRRPGLRLTPMFVRSM